MPSNDCIAVHLQDASTMFEALPGGCHLSFLTSKDVLFHGEDQYVGSRSFDEFYVVEIKGRFQSDWSFSLLPPDCFWLQFQFIGESVGDSILSHATYRGFHVDDTPPQIDVKSGKASIILLGLKSFDDNSFKIQWPLLSAPESTDRISLPEINLGYRIKQVFAKIQRCVDVPFSLL